MKTIYFYVLDTLADWEAGLINAELHSKRFFKKDAPEIQFKTVGASKDAVTSMGGLTIVPDCTVQNIVIEENTVLLLPGADTWSNEKHGAIIQTAKALLSCGGMVCAICGATVALANAGFLDNRRHTSNGAGFLEMFAPSYKGANFFVDAPSVIDGNVITASCTGGIMWAKQILSALKVFSDSTLDAWFNYFSTGRAEYFYAMMQSVQNG